MQYIDQWVRLFLVLLPHICLILGSCFLLYHRVPGAGWFVFITAMYTLFCSIKVD